MKGEKGQLKEVTEYESLLTLKQISKYLQVSNSYVYILAQKGKIPVYKIGRQWRFRKNEINCRLSNNK